MDSHRSERVSEALRKELSEMIGYELSDPRIGHYMAKVPDFRAFADFGRFVDIRRFVNEIRFGSIDDGQLTASNDG